MYISFGWPKVLAALDPGTTQEEVVHIAVDQDYFVLVSTSRIQLWTGGQHRVKLGTFTRDEESIRAEGLNRKAFWSSSKRSLAVLTYNNVLHVYGMHTSKESIIATAATLGTFDRPLELKRVDIYLQQSQVVANNGAIAGDFVGDSRALLLGFSDGSMQLFSWQAKLRATIHPFTTKEALRSLQRKGSGGSRQSMGERDRSSGDWRSSGGSRVGSSAFRPSQVSRTSSNISRTSSTERISLMRLGSEDDKAGVECMDYCAVLHLLAAVLSDGRCAILRTGSSSLGPGEQITLSHWLSGPGAPVTSARISGAAQLVSLGLASGEVALHRLWGSPAMEPLRTISLGDWGYEPEVTGSVSDLQWSPDGRALAVGWKRSGLGVWSPAGCRLLCTLRQASGGQGSGQRAASFRREREGPMGLEGGISVIAWGVRGYRLLVAESGSVAQVMELILAKSLPNSHRVPQPDDPHAVGFKELFFLLAEDRLLQISDNPRPPGDHSFEGGTPAPQEAGGGTTDLSVHHLKPPAAYVAANWPLQHAALSPDGVDVAVAGQRGLALYSRRSSRWRLFGDVSHEKELSVHALLWMPRMVLVCATLAGSTSAAHLLLFPRYHLDNASILARYPLDQIPLAIDVLGASVAVASAPLDIRVLRVDLTGDLTPLGTPTASFQLVRELSIMSVGQPLQDIALVELPSMRGGGPDRPGRGGRSGAPLHCVLLRAGGVLSVLDMEQGSEVTLSEDIECFWLSSSCEASTSTAASESQHLAAALDVSTSLDSKPARTEMVASVSGGAPPRTANGTSDALRPHPSGLPLGPRASGRLHQAPPSERLQAHQRTASMESELSVRVESGKSASTSGSGDVEIPWWTYGARGMQLWFPSSLTETMSPRSEAASKSVDPELEFDKEVYPIGISLAEVAIIGVTQRVARCALGSRSESSYAHSRLPQFQVLPETQPVLPCLLRRLLIQSRPQEAFSLATQHAQAPHFARSLEWLLFTSLEINADLMPSPSKLRAKGTKGEGRPGSTAGPLLTAAADLLRQFPQFAEIVVRVARKTDAAMWGALFAAVGSPSGILEGLLGSGALQSAACCLVIVDKLEGSPAAFALCLRLIKVTVSEGQYSLTADLIRFIVPPSEDSLLVALPHPPPGASPTKPQPGSQARPKGSWLAFWFGRAQSSSPTSGANGTTDAGIEQYLEGSEKEQTAWRTAWRLVGSHAWRLLGQGRLRSAGRLGRALADVGASLPALLSSCREGKPKDAPDAAACLSALQVVEREFPLSSDQESLHEAAVLKEACQVAQAHDWLLALALHLEDTATLADFRQQHSVLWTAFLELAQRESQALPYRDVMAAVDSLPSHLSDTK